MVGSRKVQYLNQLMEKAKQLGIENVSENQLISNFLANYDFYNSILEKSVSDGIISVNNKVELYKYRASIITDDLKLINAQKKLTQEDAKILTEILKIVDQMRENEEKFPSMV